MKYLTRGPSEVIAWSRNQITHPDHSWRGLCQSHCRNAYGVSAWASSAIQAWEKIPNHSKHVGGSINVPPRGALLYYSGGEFGHVAIAIGKKTNDKCLSNDYVRQGMIDVAPRTFPRWGIKYLGWSLWTPHGILKP